MLGGGIPSPSPWWHSASATGLRRVNADSATAFTNPVTQDVVFALADGIGDDAAAAHAAEVAASVAARTPADEGPVSAVLTAQMALRAQGGRGDCVLVVAVPCTGEGGPGYRIGWVGDVRAYLLEGLVTGDRLRQLTTDHTLAQYLRDRGQPTSPRMEHLVTTSVRTVRPHQVGSTEIRGAGTLVLTSDGVHKVLTSAQLRTVLAAQPAQPARALVDAAIRLGGSDNATAMVIDAGERATATLRAA